MPLEVAKEPTFDATATEAGLLSDIVTRTYLCAICKRGDVEPELSRNSGAEHTDWRGSCKVHPGVGTVWAEADGVVWGGGICLMRPAVPAATVWTKVNCPPAADANTRTSLTAPNTRQSFGGSGLSLRFPAGGAETEGWDRTREQVTGAAGV